LKFIKKATIDYEAFRIDAHFDRPVQLALQLLLSVEGENTALSGRSSKSVPRFFPSLKIIRRDQLYRR
jgi:hypothetical protein